MILDLARQGLTVSAIARRTGHDRKTVQKAIRSDAPPSYERPPRGSKLDPFKGEIERLLEADPRLPGTRVRELITELGYAGSKTILDDYLRELRPRYLPRPRTFQRTIYRPGATLQVDLFGLRRPVPVGHGQTRKRRGSLEDELKKIERVPLIVVDEVGYIPFDPEAANLMFMLVARRYERASVIVTSNKPFSAWGEIFGDDVTAAAMIDRLVHHAEIVALKGDSYRLRDRDLARPTSDD